MSQSHAQVLVHVVFSTKNRRRDLLNAFRSELHSYIGGIVYELSGKLLCAGSVEDHIHLLISMPRTVAISTMVERIKTGSTQWIKHLSPEHKFFQWQSGYGVFSISPTHQGILENYILNQAEHHQTVSFQEEYRKLLKKYDVAFDESYVWG